MSERLGEASKQGPEGKASGGPSPQSGARIPVVQAEGQESENLEMCPWNHIPRAETGCRHHVISCAPRAIPSRVGGGDSIFLSCQS